MVDADLQDQLIGDIYEAGADPAAWSLALNKISDALGVVDAVLGGFTSGGRPLFVAPRTDPDMVHLYAQHYHARNPLPLALLRAPSGLVIQDRQLTDIEAFRNSAFYNEWCLPQGHVVGAGLKIDTSGGWTATLMVSGRQAMSHDVLQGLEALGPHFTRALRINQVLAEHEANTLSAFAALDHSDRGIFYVSEDLRCEPVNRLAEEIVARADGMVLSQGMLVCVDSTAQASLQRIVAAKFGGTGGTVVVPRAPPQLPLTILAVPMSGRGAAGSKCKMMLVVTAPELILLRRVERLQAEFRLTPAEGEVLRELAFGGDRVEIAQRLGVSIPTVRTQLTSIFDKSGVRKQAELIRLLMSPF
ncbi:helix-turn-helix transcriptional regulator [Devosia sp. WQ 349]|uniref:helix-turn-helix transcriptional regulator n=1 Tax=Devosia sp. WQ 349K1 TaxID=2800329 RepID=UPI001903C5C5|nr:helix-turn-helix transcriptional regulator [Devosia sp. WQ 349K1]MBK1794665.1 helix-turn-helix transcriptional regulator [Devosia sp. WQ 349K1]